VKSDLPRGVCMLVTMVYTAWSIRERHLRHRPEKSTWQIIVGSFDVDVRGNPDFFWLSLSRAVTNIGFYMFLQVLYLYALHTLGSSDPARTTMVIMLPAIGAAALSSIPPGILSDRIGRRRLVFAAQFLMAFGALEFALGSSVTVALIAAIPAGPARGGCPPRGGAGVSGMRRPWSRRSSHSRSPAHWEARSQVWCLASLAC